MADSFARVRLLVALLALGCQGEHFNPPTLFVRPIDASTGVDAEISVTLVADYLPPDAVREIEMGTSLLTWPERTPIATTAASDDSHVRFTPTTTLLPRWYAVAIDLSATGYVGSHGSPLDDAAGQHLLRRFYAASLPILNAYANGADGDRFMMTVLTGEPSRLVAGATLDELVTFRFDGVEATCVSVIDGDPDPLGANGQVDFACSGVPAAPRAFEVTVAPGIVSRTGVPLRDGHGRSPAVVSWDVATDGYYPLVALDDAFIASTNTP